MSVSIIEVLERFSELEAYLILAWNGLTRPKFFIATEVCIYTLRYQYRFEGYTSCT
jgi:hypothetical protein